MKKQYYLIYVFIFCLTGITTALFYDEIIHILSTNNHNIAKIIILSTFLYCCGSIPFGLIITKFILKTDIRTIGSKNIGATNVLRTGKKSLAILTLLLDLLKGLIPFVILNYINTNTISIDYKESLYYLLPVIGHMFPCWLKFKGGKGVATGLGVLIYYSYSLAIIGILIWLLIFWRTKLSSLSALISFALAPLMGLCLYDTLQIIWIFILTILIFCKHTDNIVRIINKQEKKIGRNSIQKK